MQANPLPVLFSVSVCVLVSKFPVSFRCFCPLLAQPLSLSGHFCRTGCVHVSVLLLARVDLLFPVPIRFIMSSLNTLGFVDFLLPPPCLALYLPTPASSDSHTTWSAALTPDIFQPLLQLYCFRSQPWQENWLKWTLKANRKEVSSHLNDVKSTLPEQAYRM